MAEITSNITTFNLVAQSDWDELKKYLDQNLENAALANLIEQLQKKGVRSAIIEYEYLDRDLSEDFKAFYATLFRRYRRHASRLHFFTTDIDPIVSNSDPGEVKTGLEAASENGEYVGFLVGRPHRDAPIGKAVLNVLQDSPDNDANIQVRARYETHLLGATMVVEGFPFTQQDARITACAQASIWMAGRHFHTRYKGPWFSTVDVAEAALQPTDAILASSLPAGAGGLSITNMVRALRAMDRHPYAFNVDKDQVTDQLVRADYLNPESILVRYVESGIPVIVGLKPWETDQRDGHAVVVVGTIFRRRHDLTFATKRPNFSEFVSYFLVHDDQRGINLRMPVVGGSIGNGDTPYNVKEHVFFILVPLPDKVFITAESAERKAWNVLEEFYENIWADLKTDHTKEIGNSIISGDTASVKIQQNCIIARTYLTIGWAYKKRLAISKAHKFLKSKVMHHDLPRWVWVTEFGIADELNHINPADRRIFGHCVIDSTASAESPPLILHVPGFIWLWSQESPDYFANTQLSRSPIHDDVSYEPRSRPK